jgi:hypothetical protein
MFAVVACWAILEIIPGSLFKLRDIMMFIFVDSTSKLVRTVVMFEPNLASNTTNSHVKENARGLAAVWPPWSGAPGAPDVKTAP